jgi:hypothetical protein
MDGQFGTHTVISILTRHVPDPATREGSHQYPTDHLVHNDLVVSTVQFTVVLAFTILVMLLVLWQQ